jgi:tripartite-type tricarboxylate transporter receptor subunit TctC
MKTLIQSAAVALGLMAGAGPALAQSDFPNKPIRMVVPFAAGGGIDITARIATEKMSEMLGSRSSCRTRAARAAPSPPPR